jgi:subtilisin family serine protease
MDDNNHGTHVAGIIGAVGNNGLGVVGVNWNVKIMACKFLGADGYGTIADAIACLEYVATMKDHGVNIVATNNSWGSYGYSQALYDAIDAQRAKGILFIAAAGNYAFDNDNIPLYPASYELPNVISVAASDEFDQFTYFTNYGRATVHLLAPGSDILSTTPQNTYASFSGTSMAAPHVTGIAALLKSQDLLRDWRAIKNLILTGDTDLPSFDKNFLMTGKRANAYGSLTCANSVVYGRLSPRGPIITTRLAPLRISVQHINCAKPNGNVSLTVEPGGFKVLLKDDGIAPDQVAGDGIYTGFWVPKSGGAYTIQFPDGDLMPDQDSLKIFVDPDLEPGFPVKTFHGPGMAMAGQALHTLVADIDGDQRLEIIVTALATGPLYAWKFDGSPVTGWPLKDVLGAGYPAAGELSSLWPGNEVPAAYFGIRPAESFVSANSGDGTVLPGWPHRSANYNVRPPIIADFDGDGIDEILVGEGDNRVHIYKTDGTELSGWPPPYDHIPLGVADLDGDGDLEIITVSANSIFAYHHNGALVNGFPVLLDGSFIGRFAAIGDVDGDGKFEIVIPSFFPPSAGLPSEYGIQIIAWDGIIKRRIMAAGAISFGTAPALADLDGDGVPEIILQTDGALNVWRGDGSSFPGWPVEVPGWMFSSSPVVGDVDGDGLPEIVVTSSPPGSGISGSVWVFHRNGALDPRFPKTLFIGEGAVPAIADIDGDGRNEIIVTGDYWDGFSGDYDKVWVYDLGGAAHGPVQWGQFMGSPKHQGVYGGGYAIPKQFLLAIRKEGTGSGTVTSDVAGIKCGTDCSEAFSKPTVVTLTAVASANFVFLGWHGSGCRGVGSCTLSIGSDVVVTATFAPQVTGTTATLYVRSLNPSAGADITISQADIFGQGNAPSPFNRTYYDNVSLTLSAASTAGGNVFQKWLRDGVDWSTSATTQVFMAADHSMTAVYVPQSLERTLTIASSKPNDGVPITVTPNDKNGQGNGNTQFTRSYSSDTTVTLTAPATLLGNRFVKWSGCNSSSGTTCNVFLSGNKTVTAAYLPDDIIPPDTTIISGPTGTIATHNVTFSWTGSDNLAPTGNLLYAFQLKPRALVNRWVKRN